MCSRQASMESLPEEMREHISQYLAPADLASCCAVSHSWRDMFGRDRMWKVHCDESLSECLNVKNCVVKPRFTSPQTRRTSLSPIGEWRLNYMKEVHLRNNWSLGNFEKKESQYFMEPRKILQSMFFNNDYILIFKKSELELWNVKRKPRCQAKFPFKLYSNLHFKVFQVNGSSKFVTIEGLLVRVFSLCCTKNKLQLQHMFSFDMPEKCSESTEEASHELFTKQSKLVSARCTVVGSVLVGINININPMKMHIWNVESGQKLKEEVFPVTNCDRKINWSIQACDKTMNIVLEGEEWVAEKRVGQWFVYSLTKLTFFDFQKVQEVMDLRPIVRFGCLYSIIFDKYIAIRVDSTMSVYNYFTSQLLFTAPCRGRLFSLKNYVVFEHKNTLNVVSPCNQSAKEQFNLINCPHSVTTAFGDNVAISTCHPCYDTSSLPCGSVDVKDGCQSSSKYYQVLSLYNNKLVNQAGTKMMLRDRSHVIVLHFW